MVHDFSRPVDIRELTLAEKLHGHVCLEFKDEKTGKRERIEHDNKFTNGIIELLRNDGFFCTSPYYNGSDNYLNTNFWRGLIGGVYMFDKTVPEGSLFKPKNTLMTANGSYNYANNSLVTELGSYNNTESTIQQSSIMLVYDWTTSQGNGNIASVCLGTRHGGLVGYGNSTSFRSKLFSDTPIFKSSFAGRNSWNVYEENEKRTNCLLKDNRVYYLVDFNNSSSATNPTIKIGSYNMPVTKQSLFWEKDEKTIQMPSGFNWGNVNPISDGKYVFLDGISGSRILKNGTFTICVVDAASGAVVKTKTITNTTDYELEVYTPTDDKYMRVRRYNNSSKLFLVDIDAGTISEGPYRGPGPSGVTESIGVTSLRKIAKDIYISGTGSGPTWIYDIEQNKAYPTNAYYTSGSGEQYDTVGNVCSDTGHLVYRYYSSGTSQSIYVCKNPMILNSICNLAQPVTKTSSTTMKLIYTVTPA